MEILNSKHEIRNKYKGSKFIYLKREAAKATDKITDSLGDTTRRKRNEIVLAQGNRPSVTTGGFLVKQDDFEFDPRHRSGG